MTLEEFILKWQGEKIDFDGIYPNQCFDLAHFYIYEVLGIKDLSIIAHEKASEIFTKLNQNGIDQNYFEPILNTPDAIPQEGDIMVWDESVGYWGHVAVFYEGDVNSFRSFDANWPTDSLPHIQDHNYDGVIGWLHPKQQNNDTIEVNKKSFEELVGKSTFADGIYALGIKSVKDIQDLRQELTDRNSYIKGQNAQILTLNNSIAEIAKQLGVGNDYPTIIGELQKLVSGENADQLLNQKIKDLSAELQLANLDVEHYKQEATMSNRKVSELSGALHEANERAERAEKSLEDTENALEKAEMDIKLLKQQKGLLKTYTLGKYILKIYKK